MCQSLRLILQQSQNSDSKSISSSWSLDESGDPFGEIEQLRIDLEKKLGLENFLKAYKKMCVLFESGKDGFFEDKNFISVLKPGFEHFTNDLLSLIIKEEIFVNTFSEK
ncbi:hypothetical protein CEXT_488971 [Caerostris extrusa]|uniref:Uncharacterized protein n=1 Tax=Caerostris extrusa TaxID=172846 RepID=A0AAV4QBE9_CAEEX|nr:hypothetical protein CEXT_488971 [Caerostris extrusa]